MKTTRQNAFTTDERDLVYQALRGYWNDTNPNHRRIRIRIEKLMDEFNSDLDVYSEPSAALIS